LKAQNNKGILEKMSFKKTAYELKQSQVYTPPEVVKLYWKIMARHRKSLNRILDVGAGDGRFALDGKYLRYEGIEIDRSSVPGPNFPRNAIFRYGCAFEATGKNYDACIGNPPYVRHHNIEAKWRKKIIARIEKRLKITLHQQCNLFTYFICLGIMSTKPDGIISFIIPYEWVSRPSVGALREYIRKQGWAVHVYRFQESIFEKVETTACIAIIDKSTSNASSAWQFYNIDKRFNVKRRKNILGSNFSFLQYEDRGSVWALRGLSPGTQKVFTLTEEERIKHGLTLKDVVPCVTTLKSVPKKLYSLTEKNFHKFFVSAGAKCWLIRSNEPLSLRLKKYLGRITADKRNTYTCKNRRPWYKYSPHPAPQLLYNSGFTIKGPRFVVNKVKARTIGGVHGIHSKEKLKVQRLRSYLSSIMFEKQVVPHSGALKKIEVCQMNGVLNEFS